MQTVDFDYNLPQELIAQQPPAERTAARLMLVERQTGKISHYRVSDLPSLLQPADLLVLNDTRVIPARVFGKKQKTGGRVEALFVGEVGNDSLVGPPLAGAPSFHAMCEFADGKNGLDQTASDEQRPYIEKNRQLPGRMPGPNLWEAFVHTSGRPKPGDILLLANGKITACVRSIGERGRVMLEVSCNGDFSSILETEGLPPLPPYIKRPKGEFATDEGRVQRKSDYERYQTVYAKTPGAIAAPTAGLHFSEDLLVTLCEKGVRTAHVTLHVGPGTFVPVKSEMVKDHKMEPERYLVGEEASKTINAAIVGKRRIIAVGTTVVRTIESAVSDDGKIVPGTGSTNIFIYPPYRFKAVNALLTNFHLPKSTLLMLVSAFAGRELIRAAYDAAIREKYRFYSYGDCMLIL